MQISFLLNDYRCQDGKVKCVTGECRNTVDDCPSQITCPDDLPIQCRDGQCVASRLFCEAVDRAVAANLESCSELGLLLCTSDLKTCTKSLSQCPSRSSCPVGFIKCWDESCVNVQRGKTCPQIVSGLMASGPFLSTCPDRETMQFHCFADGSCRASLEDCPSISYCPPSRPVKCAGDQSCRKSVKSCPTNFTCPDGFRFCSGEGTCVPKQTPCGTLITCPANIPYKCEDGACVSDLKTCF